jgi:hypothetical protein
MIVKNTRRPMAKILLDTELLDIVRRVVQQELIDDAGQYSEFLFDLGNLVCKHFGGRPGMVGMPDGDLGWSIGMHVNECVPTDGGIFQDYDTDVTWLNNQETQE